MLALFLCGFMYAHVKLTSAPRARPRKTTVEIQHPEMLFSSCSCIQGNVRKFPVRDNPD